MAGAILSTGRKDYCTPQWILKPVRDFFLALNGRGITLDPCSNPKSLVMASKNVMLESGVQLIEAKANAALEVAKMSLEQKLFQTVVSAGECSLEILGLDTWLTAPGLESAPKFQVKELVPAGMEFITGNGLQTSWFGENTYFNPPFGYDKEIKVGIKNWIVKALREATEAKARNGGNTEIIACIPDTPETGPWKNGILLKSEGRCQLLKRVAFVGMKAVLPKPISLVYFGSNPKLFKEMFKTLGRVENPSEVYADQAGIPL